MFLVIKLKLFIIYNSDIFLFKVWVQSRGFKTLKSKTRRTQSAFNRPLESESFTPSFMKVCGMWRKYSDDESSTFIALEIISTYWAKCSF